MSQGELDRFARPYDWDGIDAVIHERGGIVAKGLFTGGEVESFNQEVDHYLESHHDAGAPDSGSTGSSVCTRMAIPRPGWRREGCSGSWRTG
ncbi:MAG: hypothetical protein VYE73_15170 [Acidobacteriota bacterium]|nr:hypothetical protein [Acidobacteriota bacterium]